LPSSSSSSSSSAAAAAFIDEGTVTQKEGKTVQVFEKRGESMPMLKPDLRQDFSEGDRVLRARMPIPQAGFRVGLVPPQSCLTPIGTSS